MSPEHYDTCTRPELVTFAGQRGDLMQKCRDCGRCSVVNEPDPTPALETGRYRLTCITCETELYPPTGRPRIPLCTKCAEKRRQEPRRRTTDHDNPEGS